MHALEPRILLDAASIETAVDVVHETYFIAIWLILTKDRTSPVNQWMLQVQPLQPVHP